MAKLGFIGLGIMGKPMARHLLDAGHTVHVYDLNSGPVKELASKSAVACSNSKEVAQKSDVIFTMLPDTPDVEAVLFGKNGVAEGIRSGSIMVDMSSISPIATKEFARKLGALGVKMLDAPVVRGVRGATEGSLAIYVGGKVSNARGVPRMSKLAIPFLPNNPPRWPEVVNAVKHLVEVYAKDAKKHERVGEWIERIGWERFFKLTGLTFTYQHIDDFTFARETFRMTPTFKWE